MNEKIVLDESIGYKIELAERMLKRELTKRFQSRGFNITPNQWVILYRLWHNDGLTQAEISEKTFKDKANITRIIDILVKKELVIRSMDQSDRRFFRINLTKKGKELMKDLPFIVNDHIEKAIDGIPKEDLKTAKAVLEKIASNFG